MFFVSFAGYATSSIGHEVCTKVGTFQEKPYEGNLYILWALLWAQHLSTWNLVVLHHDRNRLSAHGLEASG